MLAKITAMARKVSGEHPRSHKGRLVRQWNSKHGELCEVPPITVAVSVFSLETLSILMQTAPSSNNVNKQGLTP